MGCIIGEKINGLSIDINQENNNIISKSTKNNSNKNLFEKIPLEYKIVDKQKSLFLKNNKTINELNSKTNCSSYLNNTELILSFSKEFNKNYDVISIYQNILTNLKNEKMKIIKDENYVFSFGGENEEKKDSDSSSFESSYYNENNEEIDYKFKENNIQEHQFDIEYDEGKYFIKGYNNGNGIFLKIDKKILIEPNEKYIFLFNHNSYLNFIVMEKYNIVIIEYNGEKKGEFNYKFKNIILIGRSKNCDIMINKEEEISRVQFTFFYNEKNNEFFIYDGFYYVNNNKSKVSTNGIWLLIHNKIQIFNNMIFKTGKTFINCKLREN